MSYPLEKNESWWVVHPNNSNCEFKVPEGGITLCIGNLLDFRPGTTYQLLNDDSVNGWITIASKNSVVRMPYYVFARYFDAECFVRPVGNNKPSQPTIIKGSIEEFEG